MKTRFLSICFLASLLANLVAANLAAAGDVRFVNGSCGDDSWQGQQASCANPPLGPLRTIQAAIDLSSEGDYVVVADGVYTGEGNRDLDFHGINITVQSSSGSAQCIIDCQSEGRALFVHSGETTDALFQGFTVMNGRKVDGFAPEASGAGVAVDQSGLTIKGCEFINNVAEVGGAVWARNANIVIRDCRFIGNRAGVAGAVEVREGTTAVIIKCEFEDNDGSAGGVGALFGVFDCEVDVVNCTFFRHNGGVGGGAAWFDSTDATMLNCAISRNTAEIGGGVTNTIGDIDVTNCSFSKNTANGAGGGGGLHNGTYPSSATLNNSILWFNLPNQTGGNTTRHFCNIQSGSSSDPLFVQHGSDDLRLSFGSPSVDAANTIYLPINDMYDVDDDGSTAEAFPIDLAGMPRIQGDALDQGAYEGEYDPQDPADEEEDIDNGDIVILVPTGGGFNPVDESAAVLTNVTGADDGAAALTQIDWNLHLGAGGYTELGHALVLDTTLSDGEHFSRIFLPLSPSALGGVSPADVEVTVFNPATGDWMLAVAANTQNSPGHAGPVGDRSYMENPDNDWGITAEVGDYGAYWNPQQQNGFAWANVDRKGDFAFGEPICRGDCNIDGAVDPLDIASILGEWGPTEGSLCDLDNDLLVGPDDLAIVLGSWGECDTGGAPSPMGPPTRPAMPPAFGHAVSGRNLWRDLNDDGRFDAGDIAIVLGHWGRIKPAQTHANIADLNGDRIVNRIDLDLLLDR